MKVKTAFSFLLLIVLTGCSSLVTDNYEPGRIIPGDELTENYIYVGEVKEEILNWNWLFQSSSAERRMLLEEQAQSKAEELFGKGAVIKPELLSGRWHPASLLMILGAAGFVEESMIEASVWLPAPKTEAPPPEEKPAPETAIRYRIIPEADYTLPTEFITVDYKDREMLEAELSLTFSKGEITIEDRKRKQSALPGAGMLYITYGRSELTNAISRWFTITLLEGNKLLLKKRGFEDIPYVYGNDRLWWNDLAYKLNSEWEKELQLIVEDSYQNKTYRFRIIREEYELTR
jgi:hypothetical protein